jgi:hypothetical protein
METPMTETTTRTYTVRAVAACFLSDGTPREDGLIEEEREYEASALGEALAMAEADDAGRADFVYGICPEDYDIARAEGLSFNEADGLLTDAA